MEKSTLLTCVFRRGGNGPKPVDSVTRLDDNLSRIPDISQTILRMLASIVHNMNLLNPLGGTQNLSVCAFGNVTSEEISKGDSNIAAVPESIAFNSDFCASKSRSNFGSNISNLEVHSKFGSACSVRVTLVRNRDEDGVLSMDISGDVASDLGCHPGDHITLGIPYLDLSPLSTKIVPGNGQQSSSEWVAVHR